MGVFDQFTIGGEQEQSKVDVAVEDSSVGVLNDLDKKVEQSREEDSPQTVIEYQEDEIKDESSREAELKQIVANLTRENSLLRKHIEEIKSEGVSVIRQRNQVIEEKVAHVDHLKSVVQRVWKEKEALKEELAKADVSSQEKLKEEIAEKEAKMAKINQKIKDMESQINDFKENGVPEEEIDKYERKQKIEKDENKTILTNISAGRVLIMFIFAVFDFIAMIYAKSTVEFGNPWYYSIFLGYGFIMVGAVIGLLSVNGHSDYYSFLSGKVLPIGESKKEFGDIIYITTVILFGAGIFLGFASTTVIIIFTVLGVVVVGAVIINKINRATGYEDKVLRDKYDTRYSREPRYYSDREYYEDRDYRPSRTYRYGDDRDYVKPRRRTYRR